MGGKPACFLCRRKFETDDKLLHHLTQSNMHATNLTTAIEKGNLSQEVMEELANQN